MPIKWSKLRGTQEGDACWRHFSARIVLSSKKSVSLESKLANEFESIQNIRSLETEGFIIPLSSLWMKASRLLRRAVAEPFGFVHGREVLRRRRHFPEIDHRVGVARRENGTLQEEARHLHHQEGGHGRVYTCTLSSFSAGTENDSPCG